MAILTACGRKDRNGGLKSSAVSSLTLLAEVMATKKSIKGMSSQAVENQWQVLGVVRMVDRRVQDKETLQEPFGQRVRKKGSSCPLGSRKQRAYKGDECFSP